jgi:hypothetical protein
MDLVKDARILEMEQSATMNFPRNNAICCTATSTA